MGEWQWQELTQTIVMGLIFSYLVAKLISTVVNFREENLRVVREDDLLEEVEEQTTSSDLVEDVVEPPAGSSQRVAAVKGGILEVPEDKLGDDGGDDEEEEDDDWEGVESTELDEEFSAATAFVAATAADRSAKVSNDVQLQLYGFYKIATEGPCTEPQPSALKMTARAKWNAWQRLGAMPPEEAMENYIMIVNELFPSWAAGSTTSTSKNRDEGSRATSSEAKGPMGPVFSSLIYEEGSDNESRLEDIHISAREGKADDLVKYLENGISVNLRDSEGRTPLHWAIDRGHLHIAEILIINKADVNAKDNEGQTPLHYAVLCEREDMARLLVKHEAICDVKDNDGSSPSDLGGSTWNFLT